MWIECQETGLELIVDLEKNEGKHIFMDGGEWAKPEEPWLFTKVIQSVFVDELITLMDLGEILSMGMEWSYSSKSSWNVEN